MGRKTLFLTILVPMLVASARANPPTLYVSPSGNDAWSGTLAAPDAGRSDGPFASMVQARNAIPMPLARAVALGLGSDGVSTTPRPGCPAASVTVSVTS